MKPIITAPGLTIFLIIFILNFQVSAATDLSKLYSQRTPPTIKKIKENLVSFKKSLTSDSLTSSQQSLLLRLEASTKTHIVPPTLKRRSSKGPKWKNLAIKYLEANEDLDENISYADEEGDASESCEFDDDGIQEVDFYYFTWESVKKIKGSKKSVAYIASLVVPLQGKSKITKQPIWCHYTRSEYAFESKLKNGNPIPNESL